MTFQSHLSQSTFNFTLQGYPRSTSRSSSKVAFQLCQSPFQCQYSESSFDDTTFKINSKNTLQSFFPQSSFIRLQKYPLQETQSIQNLPSKGTIQCYHSNLPFAWAQKSHNSLHTQRKSPPLKCKLEKYPHRKKRKQKKNHILLRCHPYIKRPSIYKMLPYKSHFKTCIDYKINVIYKPLIIR